MKAQTTIYHDRTSLMAAAADLLVDAAARAIGERGRWMWALSGGSTPKAVYELLAAEPRRNQIDWARVQVFWGDERCVPPDDEQSNYRMARLALLDHVAIPAGQIHRMRGELAPESAAHLYAHDLRAAFDTGEHQWPVFDTILLGLGPDGHTASLFPESDILARRDTTVAETWVAKFQQYRISLTAPAINAAREKVFLVAGADKAAVVRDIIFDTERAAAYPATMIEGARWLLDHEAAAGIED